MKNRHCRDKMVVFMLSMIHFSTKNAQVTEGDSPIAAGDVVEITYRGVMGDEEHPGVAVKVVRQ